MAFPQGAAGTPRKLPETLETKDVALGLQSFSDQVSDKHVKVLVDNTTAMVCINQMGTCNSSD